MITKTAPVYRELGSLKLTTLLVALLLLTASCDNGLMNSDSNNSDSMSTIDMMTTASKKGSPANCENQVNNTEKKLLDCVTLEGVRAHQEAFQLISDQNGDSRAGYTAGYDASTDYVEGVLMNAGYSVERQTISSDFYTVLNSLFEQTTPVPSVYSFETDYSVLSYSGTGDVTAPVFALGLDLGAGNNSTSGCDASDFAGFPSGSIALMQRGACTFQLKAFNAAQAGASGAIIFNQGNNPEREGLFGGTLSSGFTEDIPVIGTTYGLGVELSSTPGVEVQILVEADVLTRTADNLLAELPGKNTDNVVMAGAVLDSPGATPGINNNGSGAAAVLETAVRMAKVKPQNSVRFAWWADNSTGVQGSFEYIEGLSEDEIQKISLYLNFDVISSPNYVTFIYDGDDSEGVNASSAPPMPMGTDVIEDLFETYYSDIGEPTKAFDLWIQSASLPFLLSGVPAGGIHTGTIQIKTPEEAGIWGGSAGEPYDPCAFLPCDTVDNVSLEALDKNSDAVAYSILNMAMNTSLINGTKAKGNFKPKSDAATE